MYIKNFLNAEIHLRISRLLLANLDKSQENVAQDEIKDEHAN